LLRRGRVTEAFGQMDEAMLLVVGGQVDPEWAGHICCMIVSACLDVADLNRARLCSEAAYRWLEDFEHAVMFTGVCRAHDVDLLVIEGDWAAAERRADLVVRDLAELNVEAVAEVEYQRGECHRLRGEHDEAEVAYERAAALGRDPQPGAALLALARGDAATAWETVCDAAARAATDPFRSARLLRAAVEIGVAGGHLDAARSAAGRLHELADTFGTSGFLAWADHCDGVVALARGDAAGALGPLVRASAHFRRMRAWCDAAAADLLLSDVHAALGDAAKAEECRDSAIAVFHRLGMPTPARRPRSELDGVLTAREAEILARVATGAASREVAESLSISEATVRRHLANIYVKLDVRTRTAAAAWAHRHGLVPEARA
jgi:DNA-binding CsgD family transcriptional regulator